VTFVFHERSQWCAAGAVRIGDQIEAFSVLWRVIAIDGIAGEVRLRLLDDTRSQLIELRKRFNEPVLRIEGGSR